MLETKFFNKKIKNPIFLASGVLGMTKGSLETACDNGCGGVIAKSLTMEPRKGHEGPNIVEVECGILNAMGYPNPGIDYGLKEFGGWDREEALVISIVGKDAKEFGMLAEKVETVKKELGASAIEAAISCPHTPGYGTMAGQGTPESVMEIVGAIRDKCKLPLIVKLSPSIPGEGKAAEAAQKAGADVINMGNSLGPGMKIDINRKKPVLGFGVGGLTGPAVKPIIVRCVYDIYKTVKIPIIATGGITTGEDAVEMIMAGASWISVGSAVYYRSPKVFGEIAKEMKSWMELNGYKKLAELKGAAHEKI
ncbi:Dihydroorotate dehydrogenase [Candidatus Bilamarchaeum dharawalense]|uniref:Dihydroorotate dehydrogenase n=1 Tax=Candidatus Bilamarchaeum dharawalense TaxID=2885759 RepID=A0A5E4LS99_9ARCH|nr:Dihydroorotate dehydrogenase [Candidatus Bilamarchaeum dharawalense]